MKQKKNKYWWQDEVIYQIYPKSFHDSNQDGVGDLKGIEMKLPYLKSLGITMIWISPIFTSPMVDNGYDIADFEGIHPDFGTMHDFDSMLIKANELNIKIVLDLVLNHTSDQHPWFQAALNDPNSPYRNYYVFKHGTTKPNNWRSIFGGSVWEKLPNEDCYYLHVFHKSQPDLNWENSQLREELYAMINRWLAKGIAGFRVDAITFIKKDQDYADLPVDGVDNLASCKGKARNRPGIELFLNELNQRTFKEYNCVTIGEAPGVSFHEYSQFIGENGYFSMIFDFHTADIDVKSGSDWFKRTNWTPAEYGSLLEASQLALQDAGWGANFIENHDQPRALSKLVREEKYRTENSAKALGLMHFMLRGTPFIYQGQELGLKNFTRHSIKQFNDISSIDNYYRAIQEGFTEAQALNFVNLRSRDNSRTPFPWDNSEFGGFSQVTPWIEMTEKYPTINAQNNQVFEFYKQLIKLRQSSEYSNILKYGRIEFITMPSKNLIAYSRVFERETLFCITNLSPCIETTHIDRHDVELILSSETVQYSANQLIFAPYQSVLLKIQGGI